MVVELRGGILPEINHNLQQRFLEVVDALKTTIPADRMPRAFSVVLTDKKTGTLYADCFGKYTNMRGEVDLKSQSFPYEIKRPVIEYIDILSESTIPKVLVCDQDTAFQLRDWVERPDKDGSYIVRANNGKLMRMLVVDSDLNPSPIRLQPIPQAQVVVLRE